MLLFGNGTRQFVLKIQEEKRLQAEVKSFNRSDNEVGKLSLMYPATCLEKGC